MDSAQMKSCVQLVTKAERFGVICGEGKAVQGGRLTVANKNRNR